MFFCICAAHAQTTPDIYSYLLNTTGATGYNNQLANVQQVEYSTNFTYVSATGIPDYNIGPWAGNPNTASGGHPQQQGAYHYHQGPLELFSNIDSSQHSPIIGYSFDGFPIYGPFGFADPNGTGGIARMQSGYQYRSITQRTSLPDGTNLSPPQYGPTIGGQYPLGSFAEDYEHVNASGDLDEYNGRICVTPEYPNGTYAYFVTILASGTSVYPHIIGPSYYGVVETANIGPGGGHVTITETTTVWDGTVPSRFTCEAPANISTTNVTATSATLNWDTVDGAHHYTIRGRVSGSSTWTTLNIPNGAPNFKNVFGLTTNLTYEWQIQAVCDANDSLVSPRSALDFFTLACGIPTTLSTNPVTTNAASLNWGQVAGAVAYEIKGRRVGASNWTTLLVAAPSANKNVFGLTPGTQYEWTIRTWCTSNGSAKSDFANLTNFTTNTQERLSEVEEDMVEENFSLFPNPLSSGNVQVKLPTNLNDVLQVYTSTGQLISEIPTANQTQIVLVRELFQAGLYIIRLKEQGLIERLIIQ